MMQDVRISLVIPLYNEESSVHALISTINNQTKQPDEIILVDGGSTDNTVQVIKEQTKSDTRFRVLEKGRSMPGRGRNIGAENASYDWIAFTDSGIQLNNQWLENLALKTKGEQVSIIYGNYNPVVNTFFEKCAAITYVAPLLPGKIRGKFIASSLIKKEVWEKTGGFPDWRAAEDLIFMEKAEQLGYKTAFAPDANVQWQLRPDIISTYKRFDLYSKYNVWAGRQAFWHYGVAKQYAVVLLFVLLGIFHSWYWLMLLPVWLIARTAKRILLHRHEFGIKILFNPAIYFMVMLITLVIDMATFTGWIKAILNKPALKTASNH